jgi:hypothetical protein
MMMHPDEVAGALARSTRVFCSNPALVDVMAAFHPSEVAALLREARLEIARPTSAVSTDAHVAMADHVCTTGALGLFEDLAELSARVVAEMRATGATRWLHVGTVHPRTVAPLASALAMRGLTSAFDAIGRCDALEYERSVRSSLVLLKPRGEVDTAISVVEARRWGVRVSLPVDFPFSTDGDARLTGAATRLGVIDSTELAARVLER